MQNFCFQYNKKDAFCSFCSRTKNPHPDYNEPIVVKKIKLNNKSIFICINCHFDFLDRANGNEDMFKNIIAEKYNLINLLQKANIIKNFDHEKYKL